MGGTGLGLSIAQEIAKTHGGSIHAKSELNKGTEILVLLPRNRDDQEDDYSDLHTRMSISRIIFVILIIKGYCHPVITTMDIKVILWYNIHR